MQKSKKNCKKKVFLVLFYWNFSYMLICYFFSRKKVFLSVIFNGKKVGETKNFFFIAHLYRQVK